MLMTLKIMEQTHVVPKGLSYNEFWLHSIKNIIQSRAYSRLSML